MQAISLDEPSQQFPFSQELLLTDKLASRGFEVERGVAGIETAFVGHAGDNDGPTIAIVAEYDALRGLGFKGVFPTGSRLDEITGFIERNLP